MLVLPSITRPASRSRVTIVASYGGRQPSRILEAHVVGTPRVAMTSLTAIGTPASGPSCSPRARASSTARAASSAPSVSTCRNACTRSSTAAMRSRWACATSTAETSLAASRRPSSAAVDLVRSAMASALLVQDPRHPEEAGRRPRGPGRRPSEPGQRVARVSPGTTTSSRSTLVSGTECEVGGMSAAVTSPTRATACRITSSWPAKRSSSSSVTASRDRRARCATSSRDRA